MSSNVNKVRTSGPDRVTGTILKAKVPGVPYPKYSDGAAAFGFVLTDFDDLGFVGDDGITKSETTDFSRIQEMGGKTVARFLQDYNAQFSATLLEFSPNVAKMLYGNDNVTVVPADGTHGEIIVARAGNSPRPTLPWVLRMVGRNNQRTMYSIPLGQLTSQGDVVHNRSSAAGQPITVETLPDEDGFDFYIFDDDGVVGAVTAVPTITSIAPPNKGAGQTVIIKGSRFMAAGVAIVTGAGGVKFGGTNATDYYVLDTNTISAVLPAGSAGATNVTVTNTTGTSAAASYTRT